MAAPIGNYRVQGIIQQPFEISIKATSFMEAEDMTMEMLEINDRAVFIESTEVDDEIECEY